MMQHYDRLTITEDPEPPKQSPIADADQHQRDQGTGHGYAHRFSLRDLK